MQCKVKDQCLKECQDLGSRDLKVETSASKAKHFQEDFRQQIWMLCIKQ